MENIAGSSARTSSVFPFRTLSNELGCWTAAVWDFSADPAHKIGICVICRDGIARNSEYLRKRHEQSINHRELLEVFRARQATSEARTADEISEKDVVGDGLRHLLASLAGEGVQPYPIYKDPESPPAPRIGINWNLMEANNEGDLAMSAEERAVAAIAGTILERFDLPPSDDEFEERSDAEDSQSEHEPEVAGKALYPKFGWKN
jgi:hypothetical protein